MDYQAIIEALDARTLEAFRAWGETFAKSMTDRMAERDTQIDGLLRELAQAKNECQELRQALEVTQKQVRDEIGAALARAPIPTYKGVFDRDADYQAGDMVTHKGSVWHCNAAVSGEAPGGGEAWTLAVKCGRDGRDLRDPQGAAE